MNKRRIWPVLATLLILIQGYLLPTIAQGYPSLLAICLLITAYYYSGRYLLIAAFSWGFLLDVASMGWFGLYIVIALTMAAGLRWLIGRGLDAETYSGIALLMAIAVVWQNLVTLAVFMVNITGTIDIAAWLGLVLMQILSTVVFAWLGKRSVKLKVWARK